MTDSIRAMSEVERYFDGIAFSDEFTPTVPVVSDADEILQPNQLASPESQPFDKNPKGAHKFIKFVLQHPQLNKPFETKWGTAHVEANRDGFTLTIPKVEGYPDDKLELRMTGFLVKEFDLWRESSKNDKEIKFPPSMYRIGSYVPKVELSYVAGTDFMIEQYACMNLTFLENSIFENMPGGEAGIVIEGGIGLFREAFQGLENPTPTQRAISALTEYERINPPLQAMVSAIVRASSYSEGVCDVSYPAESDDPVGSINSIRISQTVRLTPVGMMGSYSFLMTNLMRGAAMMRPNSFPMVKR